MSIRVSHESTAARAAFVSGSCAWAPASETRTNKADTPSARRIILPSFEVVCLTVDEGRYALAVQHSSLARTSGLRYTPGVAFVAIQMLSDGLNHGFITHIAALRADRHAGVVRTCILRSDTATRGPDYVFGNFSLAFLTLVESPLRIRCPWSAEIGYSCPPQWGHTAVNFPSARRSLSSAFEKESSTLCPFGHRQDTAIFALIG